MPPRLTLNPATGPRTGLTLVTTGLPYLEASGEGGAYTVGLAWFPTDTCHTRLVPTPTAAVHLTSVSLSASHDVVL